MTLPLLLFSAAQIRQIEAGAIANGVASYTLMQRAAAAAGMLLQQRWPDARSVTLVCGTGNNGGDGFALATLLRAAGCQVTVLSLGEIASLPAEAARAHSDMRLSGVKDQPFEADTAALLLGEADVVVDAVLGIGVRSPLQQLVQQAIAAINACGRPILALDLPSGLDPDRGTASMAVSATATISFIGWKQGQFQCDGPDCCGELHLDSLELEPQVSLLTASMQRIAEHDVVTVLPRRIRNSHKGMFGRVLIVGGGAGMPGAVRLAGEAALRVGGGLVTVASLPQHEAIILGARPELMFRGVADASWLEAQLSDFDVIAIGPGLGLDAWGQSMLQTVLAARVDGQSLVIDADALTLLARHHHGLHRDDWVLTPHPGEAATLLGVQAQQVQSHRSAALSALIVRRGGTIVLKGAGTLVGKAKAVPLLCDRGNPGMAVPGMGDVLTGAIAGLLAQNRDGFSAAAAAVFLHAVTGDRCAKLGERGLLALEVATGLRGVLAEICE
jgi:ADP-dependent NAD(P)H-hydrate dehydratase / NAD(P)H-hydrate epimerase